MNEREWWEISDELAALARVREFCRLLQNAKAGDRDSLLKVLVSGFSEEAMEASTHEHDNLTHSIRQVSHLLTQRSAISKEVTIEFSKMVDLLLAILRTEQLPYERSLSRAFRWAVAGIMRMILDANPEVLLIGRQVHSREDVAARLTEAVEAFKVASIHLWDRTQFIPKEILHNGTVIRWVEIRSSVEDITRWFFLPKGVEGLVEELHQRLERKGHALVWKPSEILDWITRKVGQLSQWQDKEVITMALDKDSILAYTDIRFRMQDVIDVIREAVEAALGKSAQEARFNDEWGDAGAIEVEFQPKQPHSSLLDSLPFTITISCESVVHALIEEVLTQTGQTDKLEAHPGNIWIDEKEIGFALTPKKRAQE